MSCVGALAASCLAATMATNVSETAARAIGVARAPFCSFRTSASGTDVNALLSCSRRCELYGPEMRTQTVDGDGRDPALSAALPERFPEPRPGLDGSLYVVHGTSVRQAVDCRLSDGSTPLDLTCVRNRWTPAWRESWYRAKALPRPDEYPLIGDTVVREKKCITRDNVFVCETTVKNTGRATRRYSLELVPQKGMPTEGEWSFKTASLCESAERKTFVGMSSSFGGTDVSFALGPHEEKTVRYSFAISPVSARAALDKSAAVLKEGDPWSANAAAFNDWMRRNVPDLVLRGDPDAERLYWYRWFVVWCNLHEARRAIADHEYPRQAIFESPCGDWFGNVIGLSVPLQVRDATWMRDGAPVRDHLLNWADGVKGYHIYIQHTAQAAARYLKIHPDRDLAAKLLPVFETNALARAGTDENALPQTHGSWGTGAEYQPNFYQFTDPPWDYRHDAECYKEIGGDPQRDIAWLTRLDEIAFVAADLLGCAELAETLGDVARAERLRARAEKMLAIVKARHWSEALGLFLAADPKTGMLCDQAACYDSFAPYMWDLVAETKYDRAFDKVMDRRWFWDDFAVTTVAKTCPMYSGLNVIDGPAFATPGKPHYYGCCWNGPNWHYADSLVAEAFGRAARRDPARRTEWLTFFHSWCESHFVDGDRTLMRTAEHFRPEDGGRHGWTCDYFHSAWIDPFIRYYCGIDPDTKDGVPLFKPFYQGDFRLGPMVVGGREYVFEQVDGVRMVNGKRVGK